MLNVVIASENYIEALHEHRLFLDAYLKNNNVVFCRCDYGGRTLGEMVPDLFDLVPADVEWKAIVVAPEMRDSLNPFDYVMYVDVQKGKDESEAEYVKRRREARFSAFEKAAENPLTKLITALNGADCSKRLMKYEAYRDICSGKTTANEYMLKSYLESVNLTRLVRFLRRPGDAVLERMLGTERYGGFVDVLQGGNVDEIIGFVGDENIPGVISVLSGGDPCYFDAEFLESSLENYKKHEVLQPVESRFCFNNSKPSEVICVALRTYDVERYSLNRTDSVSVDERVYSKFAGFNLYGGNVKFLVYDIHSENDKRYGKELVRFLLALMTLTKREIPSGVLEKNYLYRLRLDFDEAKFSEFCSKYVGKLHATKNMLLQRIVDCGLKRKEKISRQETEEIIETEAEINIESSPEYPESSLKVKYDQIGLAGDCPVSERTLWYGQKRNIFAEFNKYLRQPRYAIKTAVDGDFRNASDVEDDRILEFTDAQMEDVRYYLRDQEEESVNADVTPVFRSDKYADRLNEAASQIELAVEKRMTKKKTVLIGIVCAAAVFLGFIPLLFSQLNTAGSLLFSLVLTFASVGVILLVAFISLFGFRNKIKKAFANFNTEMLNICTEIKNSTETYQRYLVIFSNVMRAFKILDYSENEQNDEIKVMKKHILDLDRQMLKTRNMYSDYLENKPVDSDEEPFYYDFSVANNYRYLPTADDKRHTILFFRTGVTIEVPVDYINSIDAVKEDLYE